MPVKPVRVRFHLFRVQNEAPDGMAFEDVIAEAERDQLRDRIRLAGLNRVRLDVIDELPAGDRLPRRWLLDFVKLSDTLGPGKAGADTAVEDLDIDEEEFFGHETAALYLPDSGYIIVQYNHHGVRPSAMAAYTSDYLRDIVNTFEFRIILDEDAEQRFRAQRQVRRFTLGIDLTALTHRDRQSGEALVQAAARAADMNGARMKIEITVGHDRQRSLQGARDFIERVLPADFTRSVIVAGRENPEDDIEVVDLIGQKLVYERELMPNAAHRLDIDDRRDALERTFLRWRNRIENG